MWVDPIPYGLRARAMEELDAGDAIGFLSTAENEHRLALVLENVSALKERGLVTEMLEWFRRTGAEGGKTTAQNMTKAQRAARAEKAAAASAKVRTAKAKAAGRGRGKKGK